MGWHPAPCLMRGSTSMIAVRGGLVGEVNRAWPNRDHLSDGSIGDASHSARASDHNPCRSCTGVRYEIVRAVDIDSNGPSGVVTDLVRAVLKAVIGHPAVYYVIWNGTIWSRSYGWRARKYTGSNSHSQHVHVSVLAGMEFWEGTWLTQPPLKVKPQRVSLSRVREEFLAASRGEAVEVNNGVARIQQVLTKRDDVDLVVDGLVGPATLAAWAEMERRRNTGTEKGQDQIPDRVSLALFAKGRFGLVA